MSGPLVEKGIDIVPILLPFEEMHRRELKFLAERGRVYVVDRQLFLPVGYERYTLVVPGMTMPASLLSGLCDQLQASAQETKEFVTPMPLGGCLATTDELISLLERPLRHLVGLSRISTHIPPIERIDIVAPSFAGRIGAEVVSRIAPETPDITWHLCTAGTPIVRRPPMTDYLRGVESRSPAFQAWDPVRQPQGDNVWYTALYLPYDDELVPPEVVLEGCAAQRKIAVPGLSHMDFFLPPFAPTLIEVLRAPAV